MPTWAIDLAVPGSSLEASTKALTAGLLQGRRGQKTFAVLTVDSQRPSDTGVAAAASTQLIDSFYLNFGLRVVQSYLGRLAKLEQAAVAH